MQQTVTALGATGERDVGARRAGEAERAKGREILQHRRGEGGHVALSPGPRPWAQLRAWHTTRAQWGLPETERALSNSGCLRHPFHVSEPQFPHL